jgi:hypothetical protein
MSDNNLETGEYIDFDKSFKLVGQYFSAWARMESKIDEAIRVGLGLTALQGVIVCVNVGFTSKCHILQTLIGLGTVKKKGKRDENEKLFERLKNLSADRNMVAHTQFFPEKTKKGEFGVLFTVIKAKGNFSTPNVKWSETIFEAKIEELYWFADKIKEIGKSLSYRMIAAALTKPLGQPPTIGGIGLGFPGLLNPLPQAGLLSESLFSTLKKQLRTPQESEE